MQIDFEQELKVHKMIKIFRLIPFFLFLSQFSGCLTKSSLLPNEVFIETPDNWEYLDYNTTSKDKNTTFWIHSFNLKLLNDAVYTAWNENPELLSVAEQTLARGEEAIISGAQLLPDANLALNGSRSKRNLIGFNLPNGDTSFTSDSFNSGINLSWEVDLWGKIREQKRASEKRFQLAKAEYQGLRLSIAGQVSKAWFSIIANKNQVELARQTTITFKKNQEFLANRFAIGLVSALDNDLATNALASAQANQSMLERKLNASIRKFELLLGQKTSLYNDFNDTQPLPKLSRIPIPQTPSQILQARPDLQTARFRLEASGHELAVSKKSLLPAISISGTSGSRTNEFGALLDNRFRTWEMSGSITQPLFNAGRLRANIRRSEALKKAAEANYRAIALRAFSEVETILANETFLMNEELYLSNATNAAKAAAQTSWNRYQTGVLGIFDTLESQRRAFDSESRLLEIQKQRILNRIELYLALGTSALPPRQ